MQIPLLQDIVVLLGLSVGVIYLFQRLRLPIILGFLATGILFGPGGLGFIQASHDIEILSEIGIILLLFIIGLEFSLSDLARIKHVVFIGGSSQVIMTIVVVALVLLSIGFLTEQSIFLGFLIALSSTAIVLSLLQARGMMNTPQGKIALGILIFQDIIVVPMMLLTPMLAGEGDNLWTTLGWLILKVTLVVGVVLISARFLVPRLLELIVRTRSRELFLITIVVICFAVAWVTSQLGLSLSLGAFLAGLVISESEYSHQATGLIIPFREIFSSFFFVSIGMLLDLTFIVSHIPLVLALTAAIMAGKFLIITLTALILKFPLRTSIQTGLILFQVGEFSFILADYGLEYQLIGHDPYQYFLSVSILTMALTPFLIAYSDKLANLMIPEPAIEKQVNTTLHDSPDDHAQLQDHLIIIGYGLNGQYLARIARASNIPYVIIDINAQNVKLGKSKDEPILYGDAATAYILEHVHVYKARVAVVAISDLAATRKVVSAIRNLCNTVRILVRSRFLYESGELFKLGASEVISEEFETSIEIFMRVLHQYYIPDDDIQDCITKIRDENYQMLRPRSAFQSSLKLPAWHNYIVQSMHIRAQVREITHIPLRESRIKNRFGVTILAIQRDKHLIADVNAATTLEPGDVIHVFGPIDQINIFQKVLTE